MAPPPPVLASALGLAAVQGKVVEVAALAVEQAVQTVFVTQPVWMVSA